MICSAHVLMTHHASCGLTVHDDDMYDVDMTSMDAARHHMRVHVSSVHVS
jgi:hypothetical protein